MGNTDSGDISENMIQQERKHRILRKHMDSNSDNRMPVEGGTSYRAWYHYGAELLRSKGIDDAESDAWILMEAAANIDRGFYSLHLNDPMDQGDAEEYYSLLRRRAAHVPVQYITGEAWFYGYCFKVTGDVLIPRQDTETLVEEASRQLIPGMHILDLCTGSGCILLSLLKDHSVTGVGVDLSEAALAVAADNQRLLGVRDSQVSWIHSDLFEDVGGEFDMIVSNPPYIRTDVIRGLAPEVRDQEPYMALDGREDGLYFERKIAEQARMHMHSGSVLFLEIGYDQGEAMRTICRNLGYEDVAVIRDLGGNDRVIRAVFR